MNVREMNEQIPAFRDFNESKGLKPKTTLNYCKVIRYFTNWMIEQYGQEAEVTGRRIREYMAFKRSQGRRTTTLRTYYASLSALFSFLVLDEIIPEDENPMRLVKNPKTTPPAIQPLTHQEVNALLDSFDKYDLTEHRNYVMVALMLDTGLRRFEVVGLTIQQVDLQETRIEVVGKGSKPRHVYIGETMSQILDNYILHVRPWFANGKDGLFPPSRSKAQFVAADYLSTRLKKKMDSVGIPRANSTCHRLRHTFAVNYIRNGGNVFSLQQLLGHSTLEMTRRYVMLAETDLALDHARASPLDHF